MSLRQTSLKVWSRVKPRSSNLIVRCTRKRWNSSSSGLSLGDCSTIASPAQAQRDERQREVGDDDIGAPVGERMPQPSHCQSTPTVSANPTQARTKG